MKRDYFHRDSKEQRVTYICSPFCLSFQMRDIAGLEVTMQLKQNEVKEALGSSYLWCFGGSWLLQDEDEHLFCSHWLPKTH